MNPVQDDYQLITRPREVTMKTQNAEFLKLDINQLAVMKGIDQTPYIQPNRDESPSSQGYNTFKALSIEPSPRPAENMMQDSLIKSSSKYERKNVSSKRIIIDQQSQIEQRPPARSTNILMEIFKKRNLSKNFVQNLKRKSNRLSPSDLTSLQFSVVSSVLDSVLHSGKNESKYLNDYAVFGAQSRVTLLWDTILVTSTIFSLFWFPFMYSFRLQQNEISRTFELAFIFLIFGDILMSFNRSRIKKGLVVKKRLKICKIYLQEVFFRDMISITCLFVDINLNSSVYSIIPSIIYMIERFPKILQICDDLIDFYNFQAFARDVISLINMFVTVIYIVHILACIWHGISYKSSESVTWLKSYGFEDSTNYERYIISFYWAAMTMTTVGYGDITPKNHQEYLFANITMIVVCILFGYTMNRIGMLLTNIHLRKADFKQNIALLNGYMDKNKIDYELQGRIRSYFNYVWELEQDQHHEHVKQLISKLSDQLKQELNYQINGMALQKTHLFKSFSQEFLRGVSSIVEDIRHAPDDVVYDPDVYDGNPMYIIQSGTLAHQLREGKTLKQDFMKHKNGSTFGVRQLFTDQGFDLRTISLVFTSSLKIPRQGFLNVLKNYPADSETFHHIKDSILFRGKSSHIQINCSCCSGIDHTPIECPLFKLQVDKEKIIKTYLFPADNKRYPDFKRKLEIDKYHVRLNIREQSACISRLRIKLEEEDQEKAEESQQEQDDTNTEFSGSHTLIPNVIVEDKSQLMITSSNESVKDVKLAESPLEKRKQNLSLLGKQGVSDLRKSNRDLTSDRKIQLMSQIDEEDPDQTDSQNSLKFTKKPKKTVIISSSPKQKDKERKNSKVAFSIQPELASRDQRGYSFMYRQSVSPEKLSFQQYQQIQLLQQIQEKNRKSITPGMQRGTKLRISMENIKEENKGSQNDNVRENRDVRDRDNRKFTRTVTSASYAFGLHHDVSQADQEWGIQGFEKQQFYTNYFPGGNIDVVLKKINENNKLFKPTRRASRYTFDMNIWRKADKIRRHFEKSRASRKKATNELIEM